MRRRRLPRMPWLTVSRLFEGVRCCWRRLAYVAGATEHSRTMVTGAAAESGGGPRAGRARTALVASAPLLLGIVLAALVCYPLAGGRVVLLAFVPGRHQPLLPATAFGLDGGLTGGVPLAIGRRLLDRLLGQAGSVVPAAVFFPLATTGAARLVRTAVLPARLGAGLFYAVNPFVFDRLYAGQLGVLLGYALLPFVVTALLDAAQQQYRVGRAACWAGATVIMSEHFAWILVPVAAAIVLTRPRRLLASLRLGGAVLGAAAISAYLLVPPLLTGASPAGPLTQLNAYPTRADPRAGQVLGPSRPRVCLRIRLGHRMAHHRKPPEGGPARAGRAGVCLAPRLYAEPVRRSRWPGQRQRSPVLVGLSLAPYRGRYGTIPALARVLPDPVHRPADNRQPRSVLLRRDRPRWPEAPSWLRFRC